MRLVYLDFAYNTSLYIRRDFRKLTCYILLHLQIELDSKKCIYIEPIIHKN